MLSPESLDHHRYSDYVTAHPKGNYTARDVYIASGRKDPSKASDPVFKTRLSFAKRIIGMDRRQNIFSPDQFIMACEEMERIHPARKKASHVKFSTITFSTTEKN